MCCSVNISILAGAGHSKCPLRIRRRSLSRYLSLAACPPGSTPGPADGKIKPEPNQTFLRPVNIVHPSRSKWATACLEICHSIPTPNPIPSKGNSVTYRMPILPGLQQSLQALSAAIRTCSSPSPGRWSRTDDTGATSDGSIWNLRVRWLVPLPLAGGGGRKICFMERQREVLRLVVGSPRTAPARSAFRGWPEGVPVFPSVSIFWLRRFVGQLFLGLVLL